jgi:S-adenosyl-L-methionine hydrolase (adenosine-forming)
MSIITLLTDFGTNDEYVGVMKGVILSVNPAARIVDISHAIDPQDILQAAFLFDAAWPYFPKGTVHVLVVDPGVGSRRAMVALKKRGHTFIAPDNGVLTPILDTDGIDEAFRIENRALFLKPVSNTFHGRDIFAPVSAHLSSGLAVKALGCRIDHRSLVRLSAPIPAQNLPDEISGVVISVDRFGNMITNIHETRLAAFVKGAGHRIPEIGIGQKTVFGVHRTYSEVASGVPLAIVGSRRYLEIAVCCGDAAKYFNAKKGDPVRIYFPQS